MKMKKIMFTLAVVACAAVSQAASFAWSATQVREGWDDNTVKATGTAYLFLVSSSITEAGIASDISSAADSSALATTLTGKAIDSVDFSGGAISGATPEGISATAPASLFLVVISDDGYVYQSAATTVTSIEAIGATEVAFGSQKTATSAASAWSNVGGGSGGGAPEPTSGLLLLVGAGMLALRRKQK